MIPSDYPPGVTGMEEQINPGAGERKPNPLKLSRNMKDMLRELRRHPEVRIRRHFYTDLVVPKPLDQARTFPGDAWAFWSQGPRIRGLDASCDALERRGLLEPCGWHGDSQLFQLTEAGRTVEL